MLAQRSNPVYLVGSALSLGLTLGINSKGDVVT